MSAFLCSTLFPFLMVLAVAFDMLSRRIPHWLLGLTIILFVPAALWAGMSPADVGLHAAVGTASLLAGFAIFSFGLIGGGDAKLFAAAALWLGPTGISAFVVFTAMSGLCIALLMLAWSAVSVETEVRGGPLLGGMKPVLPYGYAIASGAILAMPLSSWGTVYSL